MAELWNQILTRRLPVPNQSASVRVALLDKEDGGSRPLSIASAIWRTVGTCVLRELRPNVDDWAGHLPELLGGMPGRDGRTLQLRLGLDLRRAARGKLHIIGAKLDLRKAFDNVSLAFALGVARALGFPSDVVAMLESFYEQLRRLFGAAGRADPHCIKAEEKGLLQGCPFSPILMNMVMSVYVDLVRRNVAETFPDSRVKTRLSVSIDDRIAWVLGQDADEMSRIMMVINRATVAFDDACGFERHHKKTESFGNSAKACEAVSALNLGPARKVTTILGVQYTLSGRRRNRTVVKKFSEAQTRLRRIPLATKTRQRREKAVRTLVLPVIR